jgi:hypothetical protein
MKTRNMTTHFQRAFLPNFILHLEPFSTSDVISSPSKKIAQKHDADAPNLFQKDIEKANP